MSDVTVTFTAAQAQVLHGVLSMVTNDPDWADMIGGYREMQTLARAHSRLMLARTTSDPIRVGTDA